MIKEVIDELLCYFYVVIFSESGISIWSCVSMYKRGISCRPMSVCPSVRHLRVL